VSPTAQLRPVLTTQGDRYAVAAIIVQESLDGAGSAELTELATRLADEARRMLLEERPGSNVTAAVAVSAPTAVEGGTAAPAAPQTTPQTPTPTTAQAPLTEAQTAAQTAPPATAQTTAQTAAPTAVPTPAQTGLRGAAGTDTAAAGLAVDRHAYRASVDGRVLGLSFREFELLAFLTEHPGRVFSRRQLVSSVWDGAAVGARTVDVHVRRLRMKLGSAANRITTVRNVGYRFEAAHADLETVA
jgi:Transcriptional regulatory protein, C terminal